MEGYVPKEKIAMQKKHFLYGKAHYLHFRKHIKKPLILDALGANKTVGRISRRKQF